MLEKKLTVIVTLLFSFSLFNHEQSLQAGEMLKTLENELKALINASKESIVTVTSNFSHEVSIEQESGIFSFFKTETQKRALSYVNVGSGVIFDESGYILTRSSIVLGAESNRVTLANGNEIAAEFIGHDPETGFAVLKVEGHNLKPAQFGNSDVIVAGSWNFMMGNSLGVYPSIVFGSVNGLRNDGMIQLSANLNPGNNGSPIINTKGEVIGLVAGHLSTAAGISESLGGVHYSSTTLAYPINWIKRIAEDIIEYGYVRKGWLGVVGYHDGSKPKIREIRNNSPAQKAGLVEGDVIVKFSYKEVESVSELARLVEYTSPGQKVPLEYMRGDQMLLTAVEVGEKKAVDSLRGAVDASSDDLSFLANRFGQFEKPNYRLNSIERSKLIEKRIDYLERELMKLKKLVKTY